MKSTILFTTFFLHLLGFGQIIENAEALFDLTSSVYYKGGFAIDNQGNTYASMKDGTTLNFPNQSSQGTGTAHLFKHNALGELQWSYSAGNNSIISDIQIDALNNIFITGYHDYFLFPATADPNNIYNFTDFVSKIDSDGNYLWITRFPGKPKISYMNNGHIVFAVKFGPSSGNNFGYLGDELLDNLGAAYMIYGELDSDGSVLWREISTNPMQPGLSSIDGCAFNAGKLYYYGYYHGAFDFGNIELTLDNLCPQNSWIYPMNMFLAVADMSTHEVTAVTSTTKLEIKDIEFDNQSNIYLAMQHYTTSCAGDGLFQGQTFPQPAVNDGYVVKLDPNMVFLGYHDIAGSSINSSAIYLHELEVKNNEVYALAHFPLTWNDIYINPNGQNYNGTAKTFILRLNENMEYKYHTAFTSGTNNDPWGVNLQLDVNNEKMGILAEAQSPTTQSSFQHHFFIGSYKTNANLISGRAFKDFNQNGIYDNNDTPISGTTISVSPDALLSVTNSTGFYEMYVDTGTYSLEFSSYPNYYTSQPAIANAVFNGNNMIDTIDLRLIPVPGGHDISVDFFPLDVALIGDNTTHKIIVTNQGTFTENIQIELLPLNYSLSNEPTTTPVMINNAGSLYYTKNNFQPGDTFSILVHYDIPIAFLPIIGETSPTTANVIYTSLEETPMDNSATFSQQLVASYDPNVKEVNQAYLIDIDSLDDFEYMEYTIHFQNEGNFYATNIRVDDKVEENLILESLNIIDYSHPVRTEILGRTIQFYFDSILLPSTSTNEEASKGYVHFKLKKSNTIELGDTISNQAFIYFDYNPPIITNYAENIIVDYLNTNLLLNDSFEVFPNPANGIIELRFKDANPDWIKIIDLQGKMVLQKFVVGQKSLKLDLGEFEPGVYFIEKGQSRCRVVIY